MIQHQEEALVIRKCSHRMSRDVSLYQFTSFRIHGDAARAKDESIRDDGLVVDTLDWGRCLVSPYYLLGRHFWNESLSCVESKIDMFSRQESEFLTAAVQVRASKMPTRPKSRPRGDALQLTNI